ncbi:hypothetical protein D3C76_1582720 [compost metagenome]
MVEGHFLGHIRRLRTLYQARQQALVEQLQEQLGGFFRITPVDAGMHLIAWLPPALDDDVIAKQLAQHNIHTYALSDYCIEHVLPPALLIGFAGTPEHQARERVAALARALHAMGCLKQAT